MSSFKNESSFLFLLCSLDYLGLVKIHSLVRGWKYFPPGSQVLIFQGSALPVSRGGERWEFARRCLAVPPAPPCPGPRSRPRIAHLAATSARHLQGNTGATGVLTCSRTPKLRIHTIPLRVCCFEGCRSRVWPGSGCPWLTPRPSASHTALGLPLQANAAAVFKK